MRWIMFLILLYFMAALQFSKLGAFPSGGNYWPEILYLPMLAFFYALYAEDASGPLAALVCGLVYDLCNDEFIGTSMIPIGVTAWLIVRVRPSIFRENPISQMMVTLLGVLGFAVISAVFRNLIGAPLEGRSVWKHMGIVSGDAVYTAIVAPLIFWVFFRFRHLLGFSSHGARGRGHG